MTYPDPKVARELEGWVRRSVDTDREGEIAEAFGIRLLPTAVALDGEGRILARIVGFERPDAFVRELTRARGEG